MNLKSKNILTLFDFYKKHNVLIDNLMSSLKKNKLKLLPNEIYLLIMILLFDLNIDILYFRNMDFFLFYNLDLNKYHFEFFYFDLVLILIFLILLDLLYYLRILNFFHSFFFLVILSIN